MTIEQFPQKHLKNLEAKFPKGSYGKDILIFLRENEFDIDREIGGVWLAEKNPRRVDGKLRIAYANGRPPGFYPLHSKIELACKIPNCDQIYALRSREVLFGLAAHRYRYVWVLDADQKNG